MFGLKIAINTVDNTTGTMRRMDSAIKNFGRSMKQAFTLGGAIYAFNRLGHAIDKSMSVSKYQKDWDSLKTRISSGLEDIAAAYGNAIGGAIIGAGGMIDGLLDKTKGFINLLRRSGTSIGSAIAGQGFAAGWEESGLEVENEKRKQGMARSEKLYKENDMYEEQSMGLNKISEELEKIKQLKLSGDWDEALEKEAKLLPKIKQAWKEYNEQRKIYNKERGEGTKNTEKEAEASYKVASNVAGSYLSGSAPPVDTEMNKAASMKERAKIRSGRAKEALEAAEFSPGLSGAIPAQLRRPERRDWTAETFQGMSAEKLKELSLGPSSGIRSAVKKTKAEAKKQKKFDKLVRRGQYLASKGVSVEHMAPRVRAAMEAKGKADAKSAVETHLKNIETNTKSLPEFIQELSDNK